MASKAGLEDRLVEARVGGVEDRVGPHPADQLGDVALRRRRRRARRRSGPRSPRRSATARARSSATSASTTSSKAGRRCAIAANAAPTPPAPTTRTFMGRSERGASVAGVLRMLRRSARPEDEPTFSTGVPTPRARPRSAGPPAPPPEIGDGALPPTPRRGAARGARSGLHRRGCPLASWASPRSPGSRWRCSRAGRWCCTSPAASRPTSATRPDRLAGRLGGTRAVPRPAARIRLQRLLPPPPQPRLL